MSSSRVYSPDDIAFERWELPHVDEDKHHGPVTASRLEYIQKQAYEEGFASGHNEGFAKGLSDAQTEIQSRIERFTQLLSALNEPFQELDDDVITQTGELAIAVAHQLVRRELHLDPGQVVGVVREAISILPVSARNIRVALHPDDAALVREALSLAEQDEEDSRSWKIVDEPLMTRGGCRITTENSTIDATIEKRIKQIATSIFGGERADD